MGDQEKPTMNDFFLRGIPIEVAREAIRTWDSLTEEDKAILDFTSDFSPLADYLRVKRNEQLKQTNRQCETNVIQFSQEHLQYNSMNDE
jgi:hypothetical protein